MLGVMLVLLFMVVRAFVCGMTAFLPAAVQVAAYVAPISSITIITVALLIGAFRGYRDRDLDTLMSRLPVIAQGTSS